MRTQAAAKEHVSRGRARTVVVSALALQAMVSSAWAGDDEESGDDKSEVSREVEKEKKKRNGDDNAFEQSRFFVDKSDTRDTDGKTLLQGSFTSTSFFYREAGGTIRDSSVTVNSPFSRLFTDLRTQLDARHIKGGKWDFRLDARARLVSGGGYLTAPGTGGVRGPRPGVQSGAFGNNELDLREAWAVRTGVRTDIFIGRQFVTDLAAVKIDGIRIDYASSNRLTLLGFAGAYPYRGSRSLSTDYPKLYDAQFRSVGRTPPIGAGFGGAYRTANAYGAAGIIAVVPLKGEAPRISATSNGYYRGEKADLYHFALIDLFGASKAAITNLSAGGNYKPSPRLRLTAGVHRFDIDTLALQLRSFLVNPNGAVPGGINEVTLRRYATNQVRGGVSAALGRAQRFELSFATAFRFRGELRRIVTDGMGQAEDLALPAEKGVEVYIAAVDRRSIKGFRFGADFARFFGVGGLAFQRANSQSFRVSASREFKGGRGQFELEASHVTAKDERDNKVCDGSVIGDCFGSSRLTVTQGGATLYYRLKANWFVLGSLYLAMQSSQNIRDASTVVSDPSLVSTSALLRIAHRY